MKILIVGANGKMGQMMQEYLKKINCEYFCIDKLNIEDYKNIKCDILLDFSSYLALKQNLKIAKTKKIPIVIGTTNHNEKNYELISKYKKYIPIFLSSNFSIGFNVILQMLNQLKKIKTYQFVIIEKHHKSKKDCPSGSAKEIEKILLKQDISFNTISLRVGEVVGEHSVFAYGENEIVELKHTAQNKMLFCEGAYNVCKYMLKQPNGYYTMEDFLKSDSL